MLTESQLAALEKAKSEKEAHGEFESECPATAAPGQQWSYDNALRSASSRCSRRWSM